MGYCGGGVLLKVGYIRGGVLWGGVLWRWGTVEVGYCGMGYYGGHPTFKEGSRIFTGCYKSS